jgi:hypothetical protein
VVVNLAKTVNPQMHCFYREYANYIKVAEEFWDWAFLSPEEKAWRERQAQEHEAMVQQEMSKIQRTL